jgi:hypothetical protein
MDRFQGSREGESAPRVRSLVGVAAALAFLILPSAWAGGAKGPAAPGAAKLDHRARVMLVPAEHRLAVEDEMRLPAGRSEVRFALHAGLTPEVVTPGVSLEALPGPPTAKTPEVTVYALRAADGKLPPTATLRYGGIIHHPVGSAGEEYDRSFRETAGTIQDDGVFLAGSTYWLPLLGTGLGSRLGSGPGSAPGSGLVTFSLDVTLPPGWDAVSEGRRADHVADAHGTLVRWVQETPVEEAHLVAAPFTVFERPGGAVATYAYLRQPDEALADRYLEAGAQYLEMYDRLIGPYPYPKLALVENFWETGYGMPSFTLLGPTVLRFPFILRSSWPHEILHNWWGNGVFPPADPGSGGGNWSEGLTAYLADHLSKEQQGQGAEYRRDLLQKYSDYVRAGNDFPVADFRSRHSGATEAVGYGKTAMVFHMLRRRLGDAAFVAGLRSFYRDHLGERATFDDLRSAFEAAGGAPLGAFFDAWIDHAGAPKLELTSAETERTGSGWRAKVGLAQSQPGMRFPLRVPVAVTVEGEATARVFEVDLDGARAERSFAVPGRPLRLAVDPAFDVFRRLDPREVPPSIGALFGSAGVTLVLPADASADLAAAYRGLAAAWGGAGAGDVEVVRDADLGALPTDRTVWVIGWANRFRPSVAAALEPLGAKLGAASLAIGEETFAAADRSVVAVAREPSGQGGPPRPLGFVAADRAAAVPGLARKLPHYGKYGYLAFEGDAPDNVAKGSWRPVGSPLDRVLVSGGGPPPPAAPLPKRSPLAELPPSP